MASSEPFVASQWLQWVDGRYLQYGLYQGDGLSSARRSKQHVWAGSALSCQDPLHRLSLRGVQVRVEEVPLAGYRLRWQTATWRWVNINDLSAVWETKPKLEPSWKTSSCTFSLCSLWLHVNGDAGHLLISRGCSLIFRYRFNFLEKLDRKFVFCSPFLPHFHPLRCFGLTPQSTFLSTERAEESL